jgi:hypothetical protein
MSIERLLLSFEAMGDSYSPSRVPFPWTEAHDPGAIGKRGRYRGVPTPYGSSSYQVPADVPIEDRIAHLHKMILPLLPKITEAGATSTWVSAGYFYDSQCNLSFSLEELGMLRGLNTRFDVSCYEITPGED